MKKIKEIVLVIIFLLFSNISARFSINVTNKTLDTIKVISRRLGCGKTDNSYPAPISSSICNVETIYGRDQQGKNTTRDTLKGPLVAQSGRYVLNVKWQGKWYHATAWQGGVFQFPSQFVEGDGGYV